MEYTISKEELIEFYIVKELSSLQIAKLLNVNKSTVLRSLKRNKIERRPKALDLTGKTFGKLTVIAAAENLIGRGGKSNTAWNCLCECGKFKIIKTDHLTRKNATQSCGCIQNELRKSPERINKLNSSWRKFTPHISSARIVWKRYCSRKLCDISFENFYDLTQQNCFYCGTEPKLETNRFGDSTNIKTKTEGSFLYNSLDRLDSNKYYTLDNVVPACKTCNVYKNNLPLDKFIDKILHFEIKSFKFEEFPVIELPNDKYLVYNIEVVYSRYTNHDDENLTLNEFYYLSQQPCFYCGIIKLNNFNRNRTNKKISKWLRESGDFLYNGLDRIDSSKNHSKDNVVPCCKYCNFGKGKKSLEEFQEWMIRVKEYQIEKAGIFPAFSL